MNKDLQYMTLALSHALKGKGKTSPNPMVGAVIVKNNRIVGQGWHCRCGGPHAEIIALRRAGAQARGAKLFVTLEPCYHFGRTPPCVDTVIASGITEVVVAMKDPNPLTKGKSISKLKRAGIKVKILDDKTGPAGLLKREIAQMNEAFVTYITEKRPFVVTKTAQTLDGKIATASGQSKWITSEAARKYSRRMRNDFDAILVGINTVLKDDPALNAPAKTKKLKKIILDSSLHISLRAKIFKNTARRDCLIATTHKASAKKIKVFQQKGIQVIVCPFKQGQVDLRWLFRELARREIANLLIEGGAAVVGSALREKLVDKMHILIAPKIMGDANALDSVTGFSRSSVNQALRLKGVRVKTIGEDLFLEGYPDYGRLYN